MIIAIDFDQTLCDTTFLVGPPVPGAIEWTLKLQEAGARLVLWTNRRGWLLRPALRWCDEHQLRFERVNESLRWWQRRLESAKVCADLFIDDRNLGCPLLVRPGREPIVNWEVAGPLALAMLRASPPR